MPRFPWKEFVLAGLIAILIAAILWVPMAHFWPNVAKESDLTLSTVQPLLKASRSIWSSTTLRRYDPGSYEQ